MSRASDIANLTTILIQAGAARAGRLSVEGLTFKIGTTSLTLDAGQLAALKADYNAALDAIQAALNAIPRL